MSVSGVTGTSGSDAAQSSQSKPAAAAPENIATQDTFLKLLVAQIRNQNPLSPADGVEFLSQLAQFSQLEQTIGIHQEISGLRQDFDNASGTGTGAASGTADGTQTGGTQTGDASGAQTGGTQTGDTQTGDTQTGGTQTNGQQ